MDNVINIYERKNEWRHYFVPRSDQYFHSLFFFMFISIFHCSINKIIQKEIFHLIIQTKLGIVDDTENGFLENNKMAIAEYLTNANAIFNFAIKFFFFYSLHCILLWNYLKQKINKLTMIYPLCELMSFYTLNRHLRPPLPPLSEKYQYRNSLNFEICRRRRWDAQKKSADYCWQNQFKEK